MDGAGVSPGERIDTKDGAWPFAHTAIATQLLEAAYGEDAPVMVRNLSHWHSGGGPITSYAKLATILRLNTSAADDDSRFSAKCLKKWFRL